MTRPTATPRLTRLAATLRLTRLAATLRLTRLAATASLGLELRRCNGWVRVGGSGIRHPR